MKSYIIPIICFIAMLLSIIIDVIYDEITLFTVTIGFCLGLCICNIVIELLNNKEDKE